MAVVIKAESLSKRYRLGVIDRRMLYEDLQSRWARFRKKEDPNAKLFHHVDRRTPEPHQEHAEFWALRDINFQISEGEAVAIIGPNGAGKSTLLKILSQITAPTSGRVLMKGRVASLLEVGTGFHPELTGRENVYLNGAILGMTKKEISRKFDAIAAFSGVEEFLDTPVKRYSSGMRVRLAFAVAAHLEPEILIIDEVLAVGDAAFQQKCLGKLNDAARHGRTVLFVSHNMVAIENLCRRGLVLDGGRLVFEGTQTQAVAHYLESISAHDNDLGHRQDRKGTGEVIIAAIEFRNAAGRSGGTLASGQDAEIRLLFKNNSRRKLPMLTVSITVKSQFDTPVFTQHNHLVGHRFPELPAEGCFVCRLPHLPLPAASYQVSYEVRYQPNRGELLDQLDNAAEFAVAGGDFYGTGMMPPAGKGVCLINAEWRLEEARLSTQAHQPAAH